MPVTCNRSKASRTDPIGNINSDRFEVIKGIFFYNKLKVNGG
jgi:hypothetical protein